MSLSRLPSGRWRCQVWSAELGRNVNVGVFDTKRDAKAAREKARVPRGQRRTAMTVQLWADRWTTDPLFKRPKESTNLYNEERIRAFVKAYGSLRLDQVDDDIVQAWLAGGKRNGQVPSLRAMFNDARSAKAGRLIQTNPFSNLGIAKTKGNQGVDPPDEATVWKLIRAAREFSGPSFAAWLQVACFSGLRPGELDALRWSAVDLDAGWLRVEEQFSSNAGSFSLPKNGLKRPVPITPQVREALLSVPRESEFCFVNLRGEHWTASSRAYHWRSVRTAVGYKGSLYLATRHFSGWFQTNILGLPSEDVAIMLGHQDGGELIRRLYGHRDHNLALARVRNAYEQRGNVVPFEKRGETA